MLYQAADDFRRTIFDQLIIKKSKILISTETVLELQAMTKYNRSNGVIVKKYASMKNVPNKRHIEKKSFQ